MTAAVFVDTNVLVYARDAGEPDKQPRALAWLDYLWRTRDGRLSSQVLHEYYVTVTAKLSPGMPRDAARRDVRALLAWRPLALDSRVLESAWTIQDRHHVGWWDAVIVAAAQVCRCRYLLSEDFQAGHHFDAIEVLNPFAHEPASLNDA